MWRDFSSPFFPKRKAFVWYQRTAQRSQIPSKGVLRCWLLPLQEQHFSWSPCSCICRARHCLEAALGPCLAGGAWSSPSLCFPARCVLLLPVTLHRPSAYSHLYLRRDLEGSGLYLFPCFLVPLYYKMLGFNNSVFYYVLFHWETQKTNPKLQRTWN